jgi:hypothetical protein
MKNECPICKSEVVTPTKKIDNKNPLVLQRYE